VGVYNDEGRRFAAPLFKQPEGVIGVVVGKKDGNFPG
jgi:hypothetical protein